MKTKSFEKKLSLNKKTIAHLSSDQENQILGGKQPTVVTCSVLPCTGPTWCQRGCDTFMDCPTCTRCGDGSAC
ncbi:MAG: hypothetical protein GY950_08265 [bacterium]|nr:hypothetical protein [bacterium]